MNGEETCREEGSAKDVGGDQRGWDDSNHSIVYASMKLSRSKFNKSCFNRTRVSFVPSEYSHTEESLVLVLALGSLDFPSLSQTWDPNRFVF